MFNKLLIILVLGLLFATASNLDFVNAQQENSASKTLDIKMKIDIEDGSDDYGRRVNERLVVQTLKSLYEAEATFGSTAGSGDFGELEDLGENQLIDSVLASGEKYGYLFLIEPRNTSAGTPPGFSITARPRHFGRTGKKSFYMNASCRIHAEEREGFEVDWNDPIVDSCSPYISYQWEYDISNSVRQIRTAQQEYFKGVGSGTYGTLSDLVNAGLLNQLLTIPWNMWINMEITPPSNQNPAGYTVWGTPQIYRETGIRSYYLDESGVIRGADLQGGFANENTPPLVFENEELIKFAMRSLSVAQRRFPCLGDAGCGGFAAEFSHLSKSRLIDFEIPDGVFGGYQFEMTVVNSEEQPWLNSFEITAIPLNYTKETSRSFYIANYDFLRGADKSGKAANENDPIVEF